VIRYGGIGSAPNRSLWSRLGLSRRNAFALSGADWPQFRGPNASRRRPVIGGGARFSGGGPSSYEARSPSIISMGLRWTQIAVSFTARALLLYGTDALVTCSAQYLWFDVRFA
jgi:hypothetical protein